MRYFYLYVSQGFKTRPSSAAKLIENSSADIWVGSDSLVHLELTLPIPLASLNQAQQVAGVERAEALIARIAIWRHSMGDITPVRVVGFDPDGQLFVPKNITQGSLNALTHILHLTG